MSPSDDPFDARPTPELLATDALLDRVGARTPTPDDLDDPLIAALALMAAEIDLDAVPVEATRSAAARARRESAAGSGWSPRDDVPEAPLARVVDLTAVEAQLPARNELRRPRRRPPDAEPVAHRAAMAPPRSLPRMPAPGGPGGSRRPEGRRERKLRPMIAVAVAITAIVLGSGVSAAVTGGRSVNPLDGIQQVVADLTGGRTDDQRAALDEADEHLKAAAKYAASGSEDAQAEDELAQLDTALLKRLTAEDRAAVAKRVADIQRRIHR